MNDILKDIQKLNIEYDHIEAFLDKFEKELEMSKKTGGIDDDVILEILEMGGPLIMLNNIYRSIDNK
jgi:hypothetical protein